MIFPFSPNESSLPVCTLLYSHPPTECGLALCIQHNEAQVLAPWLPRQGHKATSISGSWSAPSRGSQPPDKNSTLRPSCWEVPTSQVERPCGKRKMSRQPPAILAILVQVPDTWVRKPPWTLHPRRCQIKKSQEIQLSARIQSSCPRHHQLFEPPQLGLRHWSRQATPTVPCSNCWHTVLLALCL